MPNGHIFLSYRSLEADFALKLAADLQKAGIKLWMDKLDGIIVGDIWSKAIDDALKASTGLIAILTDDYFASSFVCADELGYAYTKQLPIYPLLLRDTAEKYLPFWLQNRQYLDFRQHTDEDSYQRQLNELIRHIQKRQSLIAASTAEERYLDALIRKLGKAKSGVLEYVELAAIAESNSVYANPFTEEGWDPSYTLIKPQSRQEKAPQTETLDNILNAIEKLSRFVLIGEPGAGKTTTIRRLAWDAAQRRLKHEPDSPMPLFIELPKWPSTTSIADFIRAEWLLAGDPLDLIKRGEITVFLDGLNEMGAESQDKAELLRNWLASQDMPQRVVITCRAGDYAGELKLGDLPTVQAEPLDEGRIKRFAVNYLGDRAEAFLEHILPASTLQKAVSVRVNDRSLFNLARNPYMLGVLIYLYHTAPNGQLPTNTGALFRELAQRLWERERQKQTTGWIPYEEMERALSKLAFTMIDEDQPTNVPLEYARRHVPDFALLRAAHNATLVDLSDSDLRFYHQLIQEFFAASRLVEVGLDSIVTESPNLVPRWIDAKLRGLLESLSRNPHPVWGKFDAKWHEVILACAGISENPNSIVLQLCTLAPLLASDCIGQIKNIEPSTQQKLAKHLIDFGRNENEELGYDDEMRAISNHFKNIDSEYALPVLRNAVESDASQLRELAAMSLGYLNIARTPYILEVIDILQHDTDWSVLEATIKALGQIGDPIAIPALIENLESFMHPPVGLRLATAIALTEINSSSAFLGLLKLAYDKASDVSYEAIRGLGVLGHPAAVPTLTKILEHESNSSRVLRSAAEALERIGTPEALAAVAEWRARQRQR